MSEFRPQNLHDAWDILDKYIKAHTRYKDRLQERYPQAFDTWELIIQLYDAYNKRTIQSDLKEQINVILCRARMPLFFNGVYNNNGRKILLTDLLRYISGKLDISSPREMEGSLPTVVGRGGRERHRSDVREQNLSELLDTLKTSLEF